MRVAAFFDRRNPSGIQSLVPIFALFLLLGACDDKTPPPPARDAGAQADTAPSPDAGLDPSEDGSASQAGNADGGPGDADQVATDGMDGDGDALHADTGPDAGADSGPEAEELPLKSGVFQHEGSQVLQALGRTRKSVDMGLARSAAANRARSELRKIIRKQGIEMDEGAIKGAEIVRVWRKGRWVYALARIRLENGQKENTEGVNESPPGASNSAEPQRTQPAPSEGGRKK